MIRGSTFPDARASGGQQLLTAPGPAAIAVIRAWGPAAAVFAERNLRNMRAETALIIDRLRLDSPYRAQLVDGYGAQIDDVLVAVREYAGSREIRLYLHGSPAAVRECQRLMAECGLPDSTSGPIWPARDRIAADMQQVLPRMMTLRGAAWLVQNAGVLREALRALLETADPAGARESCARLLERRVVLDWFSQPLRIAIIGPPNAGKSTLINALADQAVSVTSPHPGTTRDWLEAPGEIDGFPVVWIDTAGLRASQDEVEREGVRRALRIAQSASCIIVLDGAVPDPATTVQFVQEFGALAPACIVLNKSDLGINSDVVKHLPNAWRARAIPISAQSRTGLDALLGGLRAAWERDISWLAQPAPFSPVQEDALKTFHLNGDPALVRSLLSEV